MPARVRSFVLLCAFAVLGGACSGAAEPTTTVTTTTVVATTTSTSTTTSTTAAPVATTVTGDVPEGIAAAAAAFYSWMADARHPTPDVADGLIAHVTAATPTRPATLTARAATADLPNGDGVAVVHVAEDLLFMVREGTGPWRIVGTQIAGAGTWLGDEPRRLLVLGSDARVGQNQLRYRADSIHIVTLDPSGEGGTIVGFPRDTWVTRDEIVAGNETAQLPAGDLPGGGSKWTNLLAGRGPEIMLGTAEVISGADLEGYVITGFKGFDALIGELGGLEIDLPSSMNTGNNWANFPAGEQELTPKRTLQLARIRKGLPRGDFDRSVNQGRIMLAALGMVQVMGVDALPGLTATLVDHAWTDLETESLFTLAAAAFLTSPDDLANVVVDGSVGTAGAASVVYIDDDMVAATFADLADDGILDD